MKLIPLKTLLFQFSMLYRNTILTYCFFIFSGIQGQTILNGFGIGYIQPRIDAASIGISSTGLLPAFQSGVSLNNPVTWHDLHFAYISTMYGGNQVNQSEDDIINGHSALTQFQFILPIKKKYIFGIGISFFGMIYLTITVNPLTGLLSILTLVLYLFVYTPLKRKTAWNLFIGAIPGAIPPVGGWIAAGGDLSPVVWMLFGVLFLWQIPHFLSIAWIYRKDYQRAGFRMIGMPGSPLMITFLGTIGCSVVLLLLTLGLFLTGIVGKTYLVGATVIGVSFLILTICMAVNRSNRWAHRLLLGSVLYLPALLLFMIID